MGRCGCLVRSHGPLKAAMTDLPILHRWLAMARDDDITIDANDLHHEALRNM